ncbi:MAG: oligopeptide/dipeptide ABC transporter ATP-binding protein, partial [Acidimicrobiia bacterium]
KLEEATNGTIEIRDSHTNEMVRVTDITSKTDQKDFRKNVQMIFQDPYESMNPRRTIFDIVAEPLTVQNLGTTEEREERVVDLLRLVGLTPPEPFLFRYPHELSGGQRQRIAIARALVMDPTFVVADEPTSMLDVSIRISIMRLMLELAEKLGVTYLYITHDLAVARYMCDKIAVMYLGKIVEMGPTEQLLTNPMHPYTRALLSAVPVPDPSYQRPPVEIEGGVARAINPPAQCRFIARCPFATDVCATEHPPLDDRGDEHLVACFLVDDEGRWTGPPRAKLDLRS